ncbi:YozE family protein [Amphibacillus sp. Q70]|uniref:YozE family protein n=1 Tax=Amphibacillus sp. Q70 TaxID=3453416 RepID=UPI003F86A4AE
MTSFYKYMMRYRGAKKTTDERKLADWMYYDHEFPKHSQSYDEISQYLEWNIPFNDAIYLFDQLWQDYLEVRN